MNRRFSINFAILSMLLDALTIAFSLWLSTIIRPILNSLSFIKTMQSPVSIPPAVYWIFPVIWVLIYLTISLYDGKRYLRVVDEFGALTLGMLIASISAAGILYLSYRDFSRAAFILFLPIAYIFSLLWRLGVRIIFRLQKVPISQEKRILIVGSGPMGQKVLTHINETSPLNTVFLGFVDDKNDIHSAFSLIGDSSEIKELVVSKQATDVIIALPYSAYPQLSLIVQQMEELPVKIWVALGFFDLALYKTTIDDFAGIPMIDLRASAIDDYQLLVKRSFDLFFCTLTLILVLPLLAIISLIILISDGRPILFSQKRAGSNGRIFEMLKFRSMIRDAEKVRSEVQYQDEKGNIIFKSRNDPRVTPFGRFLRRFSLDELPQLFNILKGDMSLVGPRPELPELVEKYQPWQRKRFAIPQGLTGWWQIHGRSDKPMYLHTEDDIYYIQHYSIWLDLFILINTFWIVIRGKGAY
ncbi:MAG: sugar transferase [Chloroflexi bacterium HGW-Chloroflexi-4]|jgi:exopolysaccharide biosynthesis polyprenyl glycosylphosphotransferase|nr:MAG: sugar transferase [Chloroflexi bacterium HGW-Chloroflexi-4]